MVLQLYFEGNWDAWSDLGYIYLGDDLKSITWAIVRGLEGGKTMRSPLYLVCSCKMKLIWTTDYGLNYKN